MLILQMFRQICTKVAVARLRATLFPPSLDCFTFLVFSGRSSLLSGIKPQGKVAVKIFFTYVVLSQMHIGEVTLKVWANIASTALPY